MFGVSPVHQQRLTRWGEGVDTRDLRGRRPVDATGFAVPNRGKPAEYGHVDPTSSGGTHSIRVRRSLGGSRTCQVTKLQHPPRPTGLDHSKVRTIRLGVDRVPRA
jgi:hypothetical protein